LADELCQGDVLRRSDELDALLADVHPHFHGHTKNMYFMVLTQSCDLVIRDDGIKAPYIAIAPVRHIDEVIARQVAAHNQTTVRAALPVLTNKAKSKLSDFVRSLINNNAKGYFYLEATGTPLSANCCAFLRLAVPIKTELHYDKCLKAKIVQLHDTFQAKLGFLIGDLYSRVGTKDWAKADLSERTSDILKTAALYVPDDQFSAVEHLFREKAALDPNYELTEADILNRLKSLPSKKGQVLNRVKFVLAGLGLDQAAIDRFERRAQGDQELNRLLR